ncbi:hypothetical protein L873DRAFT_1804392 [Choiromyces venosus 120613-1]|uniref:Uncharacterized protein n=1 Tax=Choiromyces venosus 120613-1 TaxID=1336337 RepID=A0A3N4JV18_9PEZI|nr:hypothetical protein L873DRAFT_1804392 [Choiromyces venosus 120613-1]
MPEDIPVTHVFLKIGSSVELKILHLSKPSCNRTTISTTMPLIALESNRLPTVTTRDPIDQVKSTIIE